MQDFDALKKIWQEESGKARQISTPAELSSTSQRNRNWLKNTQLLGAVGQIFTAVFISWMIFYGNFGFRYWYTYFSMGLVVLLSLMQTAIMLYTYAKINAIDDAATPSAHLRQWEEYYALRMRMIQFQAPVFTLLLSLAIGIYYIEVLSFMKILQASIAVVITAAWILFAYFYLGKRSLRKEKARLQSIIDELKEVEQQLANTE